MGQSAQAGGDILLTVASSPSPSHVPPQCAGRDVGKRAVEKSLWARRNLRECLYILFLPSPNGELTRGPRAQQALRQTC